MAVIYFVAGMYILVGRNIFNFSNLQKISLGTILVAYGLIRFYTALEKKRKSEIDEDEN